MDWSKIKTIFIFAFLVLDGFLLFWLFDKQDNEKLPLMYEASFEERLEADEIVVKDLQTDVGKEQFYIKAIPKTFTDEELEQLRSKEQQVEIIDGNGIKSTLKEPLPIVQEITASNMEPIISTIVLYSDQYRLWEHNKIPNTIVYYQKYKNFTLFNNQSGRIIFDLNEKNEVIGYTQTMFEKFEEYEDEDQQSIFDAMKALETLHSNGELKSGSTVTGVELGYYTDVQLPSQVLFPTWHFYIKDQKDLYVHAIEGRIIEMNDSKTITE